jgi:hypothetical protein
MRKTVLTSIILATLSCNKAEKSPIIQQSPSSLAAKIELPNTPENVVRAWEEAINKNQYAFAKMISFGPELEFVKALEESNSIEQAQDTRSDILNLKCVDETNETATCRCTIKYEDGAAAFKYFLVRNNGQWLVNDVVPDENKGRVNQKPSRVVQ